MFGSLGSFNKFAQRSLDDSCVVMFFFLNMTVLFVTFHIMSTSLVFFLCGVAESSYSQECFPLENQCPINDCTKTHSLPKDAQGLSKLLQSSARLDLVMTLNH